MAVRLWTPVELPGVVLWACGDDSATEAGGAAVRVTNRADGTAIVPGAQPSASFGPSVESETLDGKKVLSGTDEHKAYMAAPGTEMAFSGKSGFSVFAVHRIAADLPSGTRSILAAVSDDSGDELLSVSFGESSAPSSGGVLAFQLLDKGFLPIIDGAPSVGSMLDLD